jgi:hypothetical protein
MLRIAKFKLNEVNRNISYGQKAKKDAASASAEDAGEQENAGKPPRSKSKNLGNKDSQQKGNFAQKKKSIANQDLGVKK